MIPFDRWEIREIPFDISHLSHLWIRLQEFPTLFTDETRGDIQNWLSLMRDESFVWYEVFEKNVSVGVIYFQLISDKADLHVAFFDRKPAEKKDLIRFFCRFLFDGLPKLHKITAAIPGIYYATWRLAKAVGFHWEGTAREEIVLNNRRVDVHLYSLLRSEANGLPKESGKGVSERGGVRDGESTYIYRDQRTSRREVST